ncbi:MAG: PA14 domain-containing protein [Phycisphaerae bacterium]|jgi:putative isomerase
MKNVKIGPFYADALNGIAFVADDEAAFLLRIGWVEGREYRSGYRELEKTLLRLGPCAADSTFGRVTWKVGQAVVNLDWGVSGPDGIVATLRADAPCRVAIQTSPSWRTFQSTYRLADKGILGLAQTASGQMLQWHLAIEAAPAARICTSDLEQLGKLAVAGQSSDAGQGQAAAIVLDLQPGQTVPFSAGFSPQLPLDAAEAALRQAEQAYADRRPASSGPWGDFVQAIADNLNASRVYNPHNRRIAHVVCRGWCLPDGQVLFCWDSFFNALLACVEDPDGAKETVRALLACQLPNGMICNMNHSEPDRWFPGPRSSPQSNIPMGSLCIWKMHQRRPDRAFLAEVYPALVRWNRWWFSPRPDSGLPYRDGNRDGLLELGSESNHPLGGAWESGLDDSPMYKEVGLCEASHTHKLIDVGLNALWAADCQYLALMADELGRPDEAGAFRTDRDAMAQRINDRLWNEELGIYCNRYWEPRPHYEDLYMERFARHDGQAGFAGEYYDGCNFDRLVCTRRDPAIDFKWDAAPVPGLPDENFSVRWRAAFKAPVSGECVFRADCTGGVRVLLDGRPVIDRWGQKGPGVHFSDPLQLVAGQEHELTVECFQCFRGGQVRASLLAVDRTRVGQFFSTRLSPTCFYPMLAGIPDARRVERMLGVLKDENKFWGPYVCPTIARDDVTFPRQGYWQGKIWAPTNYLLYESLRQCAPPGLLAEYARKSVELFMRNWRARGACHENYLCAGEGSSEPHYTWGALLCLIGLEGIGQADGAARDGVILRHVPGAL